MAIALGPLALVGLGAHVNNEKKEVWDCWKPILHDDSIEPSSGKLIKEILEDSRIKKITLLINEEKIPEIRLHNIWDEEFKIIFGLLPEKLGQIAAHAIKVL